MSSARFFLVIFATVVVSLASAARHATAQDSTESSHTLSQYYGFREPELMKLDRRVSNLRATDMDGNGLTDLVVIDNAHSRLDVLLARDHSADVPNETPRTANEISDH